jgi:hypothetical protein
MLNRPPRGDKWQVFIALVFVLFIIFGSLLIAGGTWLNYTRYSTGSVSGYTLQNCSLTGVLVKRCRNLWVAVWREAQGFSIVQNPFSGRSTEDLALRDSQAFPLNNTFPCMGGKNPRTFPEINCDDSSVIITSVAMLDTSLVNWMEQVNPVVNQSGDVLLALGSLILIFAILGFVLVFIGNGFCACWCGPRATDFYVQQESTK